MSFHFLSLLGIVLLFLFSNALPTDHHHRNNVAGTNSEHPAVGALLSQTIDGKEIHDGNKVQIQTHNYDSRQGVFFQNQYNGDIVNVAIGEMRPTLTTMEPTQTTRGENITEFFVTTAEPTHVMTTDNTMSSTSMWAMPSTLSMPETFKTDEPHTTAKPGHEEHHGMDSKITKREHPARDFPLFGDRISHKSVIQQHFYDGRSGILLQNQYNGNLVGTNVPPHDNLQSPLLLLLSLLRGGFNSMHRGKDETKPNTTMGHRKASGSSTDAQVKGHNLKENAHTQTGSSFLLRPLLAYVKDMVTNDRPKNSDAQLDQRTPKVDINTDSVIQTVFKEGRKTVDRTRNFMEHMFNVLGLKNVDTNNLLTLKDAPLGINNKLSYCRNDAQVLFAIEEHSGEELTTFWPINMNETTDENSYNWSTPAIEVDTFPANIRINAFNVASGGQAYQIILEHPDIKISLVEPEEEHRETTTTTTESPFPWDFFSVDSKRNNDETLEN